VQWLIRVDYVFSKAKEQALALLSEALKTSGYAQSFADALKLDAPAKGQDAGLASPVAFVLAKQAKKSPADVADTLLQSVRTDLEEQRPEYIESVQSAGGYLNFTFTPKYFADAVAQAASAGNAFGDFDANAGKTFIVEYSSPNVGKPMHIGHIRSTILGDAVANLFAASGAKVVRMNYLCEAGAQVAGILLAMETWGTGKLSNERDLLSYYVEITKKIEADPALKEREQGIVVKMESGDAQIHEGLMKARELTVPPFEANYRRLGVRFDDPVYDSDFVALSKQLAAEAVGKGLAFVDKKGETVGTLEDKAGLPNLIILRSNGTTLYSTRDMGFAEWRWGKYHFDRSVIITASEQNTHFRQVFALLKLMGREYADRLSHIGFGLVFLEGGVKLSSRKGNVLFLDDVLDGAVEHAAAQVKRGEEYPEPLVKEISETVGVGAVKFAILRVSSEKNISFAIEKAVSFEGDTGAYLQYTVVRAKNILRKAQGSAPKPAASQPAEMSGVEKELARLIARYPQVVRSSASSMSPHQICDYALKLASSFSTFYSTSPVLEANDPSLREMRLTLVTATVSALEHALGLLGIRVPEKM
jgi:arginyl-tRNA synthetase